MSLKSYLQALLGRFYSKQEQSVVAQLSMPGLTVSTETVSSSSTDQIRVAPCNGYAVLSSVAGDVNTIVLESSGVRNTVAISDKGWLSMSIPVRKGANVAVRSNPSSAILKYIATVGGGLKLISELLSSMLSKEVAYA